MATIQESMSTELDGRDMLAALTALKRGDFSVRLPSEWTGVAGKVADTFNEVVELNERMAHELDRLSRVVGKEGKISQRASLGDVSGSWADSIDSVNALIERPGAPDQRNGPRHRRRGPGRPVADDGPGDRRPAARRANSCAPPRPSTGWSISSARSPRK